MVSFFPLQKRPIFAKYRRNSAGNVRFLLFNQDRMKLADLIQEGEHLQQDFKFAVSDSRKISRSLVAFANTAGGRLLIGVKDNGAVAGIRSDEEFYMIESAAQLYAYPEIPFTTKTWEVNGKTVLQVDVEESERKPHFVKNHDGTLAAFIRIADQSIQAPQVLVRAWEKQRQPRGALVRYSRSEEILFRLLQEKTFVRVSDLRRKARISLREAEETLSNLILFEVISYHYVDHEFLYQLS